MEYKCALVIDENLPLGVIANTSAILTMTMGKEHPELVGENLIDGDEQHHLGITTMAISVLKGGGRITQLWQACKKHVELTVVDVTSATRSTKSYQEYAERLKNEPSDQHQYYGLALYGPRKLINKYTGSLGLLR